MKRFATTTLALLLSTVVFAQNKTSRVLRVEVQEGGEDGTHVNLTLPISAMAAFEPAVRNALNEISVNGDGINLQEIWQAVKDSGPMDYVEIEEQNSTIRVSTTGSHVVVSAEGDLEDNIHVSIPFELCDAMFRSPEDFDFDRLMTVLEDMAGSDLIRVDTDNEHVRVWIE